MVLEQMDEESEAMSSEWRKLRSSLAVNKPLIPLKVTMFLIYGGSSLFLPYLTLHMLQIGIKISEIAAIYAVLPFITCIAPPLAGLLADKFNSYKFFLICMVTCSAFFHTMLLFIDAKIPAETIRSFPLDETQVSAQLFCSPAGANLKFDNYSCAPELSPIGNWTADLIPSSCDMDCSAAMRLCYSQDNCNSVDLLDSSEQPDLEMEFELFVVENETVCTAWMVEVQVNHASAPANLLCNCPVRCPLTVRLPFSMGTIPEDDEDIINNRTLHDLKHKHGFGTYFMLRILASSSLAATFSMLDATAICMVRNCHGDLGKQRLFGVIGQAVCGLISGLLLDWTIQVYGVPDYSVVIWLANGMFLVVIFLIGRLDVDVERPEAKLSSSFRQLIQLVDVDVFMLMMLLLGACWGFLESFFFVFLIELKASSYLLGTTITLGCVIGIFFLYISDTIVHKIGSVNIIVVAFLLYGVRFFGYSLIRDSWLCLPFEALEAFTVHVMAVASTMYCAAAAPPGLLATMNGAISSIHYSFGRGVGSFIGGNLMVTYGTRTAFQVFGVAAFVCGIVYFILHRLFLIRMETARLQKKIEHMADVVITGAPDEDVEDDEPGGQFLIPPDNLMGRRKSCF